MERSLFDNKRFGNKLFQSDTILTSTSIQRRFQLAVKSRASKNPVVVNPKFWLLSKEETQSFIKMHPILNNSEKNPSYSEKNPSYSEKNPSYSENYDIKKSKENVVVTRAREEMIRCFEQNITPATAAVKREVGGYLEEKQVTPELMRAVIEYSALSGAKSWRYVQTVLDNCLREGITTPEQFRQNIRSESNGQRTRKKEEPCSSSIDFEALQQYVTYGGHYESEKKTM